MFTKKELKFAYVLAACLLVVGAVSYAAYTEEEPVEPRRRHLDMGYPAGIAIIRCRKMNTQMPSPAANVMSWMRAMRKYPSVRMRFTSSVPDAMRTSIPAHVRKNAPNAM
jgi:hypothetical protein